jgi:hypothetical protein
MRQMRDPGADEQRKLSVIQFVGEDLCVLVG